MKQFPGREIIPEPSSPFEVDLEQQRLFIDMNMEGYIPQKDIELKLDKYINDSDNGIFLLTAKAGQGKTMLLANYVKHLEEEGHKVYARFCGVSDLSSELYSLWKSIFDEAEIFCPATLNDLQQKMPVLLEELSQKGKSVILIDAINQLPNGLNMLSWLSRKLPDGIKLIVSTKTGGEIDSVIKVYKDASTIQFCELSPFTDKDKRDLIQAYLKKHLKALDDKHITAICTASNNPLFLKILLLELRVFGAFKQLETEIDRYGTSPEDAFKSVLKRMEVDEAFDVINPKESVPFLFGLLSFAQKGLSEKELVYCFESKYPQYKNDKNGNDKIRGTIHFYLRQVRPFMARREGRADFLYDSFRQTAKAKYKKDEIALQKILSDCFLNFCDPGMNRLFETQSSRALSEYAYHLSRYNISEAEQLYCNIPYLHIRCSICSVGELLSEYNVFTQSITRQYYTIIFRHAQTLSQYENALFSILYYSGFEHAKQQISDLLATGRWNKPLIYTKLIYQTEDVCENDDKALYFHKLAENELFNTVAIQTVKNKNLAFYSEGNGRIRSVDTVTLVTHEIIIRTLPMRPMNITTSNDGSWLAVGYDDGTVEIIRVLFNEKDIPYLSESVKRLPYFLPMYDNGIFGFNDNFFWYQKNETTLVKSDISGEENEMEIYLEHSGELSSILFRQKNVVFSIRQSDKTVLISLNMDNSEVPAICYFNNTDITACVPVSDNNIAVSMNNNKLLVLNELLEEQASITLDAPVIAAVTVKTQLFLIIKNLHNKKSVLWNFVTGTKLDILLDETITHINQISVKQNKDDSLFLISDNVMCKFILSKESAVSQNSEIIAVDYCAKQETENLIASNLVIVKNEDDYFTIIHNNITKKLPEPFNSPWRMAIFARNEVYAFDFGKGYSLSLDDMKRTPIDLKSNRNIACVGKDNYFYFYDIARNLRCLQSDFTMDLSTYNIISASFYSLENYILLAGTSDDAKSGIRKETGYESSSNLVLFYEIVTGGRLHYIGERRFLNSQGRILNIVRSKEKNWFYIAFNTPNTGKTKEPPVVGYGTIDDFLNQREKKKVLHCRKDKFSMACVNNSLLVCSNGKIIGYNISNLEYQVAMAAEEPFQFINQINEFSSSALAVCGKNEIVQIIIN